MNQLDVAALEGVLECDRRWEAVILSPKVDRCKEEDYNLLYQKPQPFRRTKCYGKKSESSSHSRQHTYGIRIPTKFPAVAGEWGNVKAQITGWAWKGGSILVSKHHQGIAQSDLLQTMRCSRCEPYVTTSSGVVEVSIFLQIVVDLRLVHLFVRFNPHHLLLAHSLTPLESDREFAWRQSDKSIQVHGE